MEYFKTRGHQLHFAINCLDGKNRMKFLGITRIMMCNKKLIDSWKTGVITELQAAGIADEATLAKLEVIAKEML